MFSSAIGNYCCGEKPIMLAKASIVRGYCQHILLTDFKAFFKDLLMSCLVSDVLHCFLVLLPWMHKQTYFCFSSDC